MDIIKRIAKANNTSEDEVRRGIEESIKAAMTNPDPEARKKWSELFPDGKVPTPEEFIMTLRDYAIRRREE